MTLPITVESHSYHASAAVQIPWNLSISDSFLLLTLLLFVLTLATAVLYSRRIRQASKAYEEAKDAVGDIVISVDKQLQRQGEQLAIAFRGIESQALENEGLANRLEEQDSRVTKSLSELSSKVAGVSDIDAVRASLESLKSQLGDLVKSQEDLKQQVTAVPELQIQTAIPIRRERALASLTETELSVLEFIAASTSGERTAPEIKGMIKLSREHTARLMKKLYEGGYLERRSEKIPYAYRVKEEMLKILTKKDEVKA